jgi:hypothetical protein
MLLPFSAIFSGISKESWQERRADVLDFAR